MAGSFNWSRCWTLVAAGLVALLVLAGPAPSQVAPAPTTKTLTVSIENRGASADVQGAPWGSVTSLPAGISCPPTCSAPFEQGTSVTLTAGAAPGYELAEWNSLPNDPRCAQTPACSLTIGDGGLDPSVQAAFQPAGQLHAVTAGPGTLSISPVEPGANALCEVTAQQESPEGSSCNQRYVTGTAVTLTARPRPGARFIGWSDYSCRNTSPTCTIAVVGERFITARFSPVTLSIQAGQFGSVTVRRETPRAGAGRTCAFTDVNPLCQFAYPSGTLVTLRRQHAAPGQFWIGACIGNAGGKLDADVCRLRLQGDELVGAGLGDVTAIPPPLGSGIEITLGGNGRGKVTGRVVNRYETLDCGIRCSISGLTRYDQIRVTASKSSGSRFCKWSDGSTLANRTLQLSNVNRLQARFVRLRSRCR